MSQPLPYTTTKTYIQDSFHFVKNFRWIYKDSNTKFIQSRTLDQIPIKWIQAFNKLTNIELNEIPFGLVKEDWPLDMKYFLTEVNKLKPNYKEDEKITRNNSKIKGISPKKIHEIENLSNEINKISCDNNITNFIDVGCGLGYLTQFLHEKYGYTITGIEGDLERVRTAIKRQKKFYNSSISNVNFLCQFIDENSFDSLNKIYDKDFGIIGMHACADLTISSIKLFLSITHCKSIIIMPCCYHKMSLTDTRKNNEFKNIPLSKEMKEILESIENGLAEPLINRPFLRLAAQQSSSQWRKQTELEHHIHGKNMFERGLVESLLENNETVIKIDKHFTETFEINEILGKYKLINSNTKETLSWSENHRTKFDEILKKFPNGVLMCEILTCLQTCLQTFCENLVLLDKVCYVNEFCNENNANIEFYVKRIVDDDLSPRCYTFIGIKK